MDRITEQLLGQFSTENSLEGLAEDVRFEHLTAFLTVRRHYSRALDSNDIVTGSGGDTGLDAIAIIVNGVLVTDVDMVEELLEQNGYLEATFIFVQAERSASFDAAKIGTFGFGVLDFFSDAPRLPRNEAVTNAAAIMTAIYDRSASFRRRPACRLYYATTGKWAEDGNLVARRETIKADLSALEMFDEVDFATWNFGLLLKAVTSLGLSAGSCGARSISPVFRAATTELSCWILRKIIRSKYV